MLGLADATIWLAYILCIISAVACVVYGILNWNKGADNEQVQIQEEANWEKAEQE